MILNRIRIIPKTTVNSSTRGALIEMGYLTASGERHQTIIDCTDDLSSFPEEVQMAAQVAQTIPETTELARIDFNCGPDNLKVNDDDTVEPVFSGRFATVAAKTKDKRVKGDARALVVCPCYECPETKEMKDTDLALIPDADLKACAEAFFAVKPNANGEGFYKELYRLKNMKDIPDTQATETVEVTEEVTEVVGDKAVVKKVTKTKEAPLFDEVPCVDANGDQICDICGTTHVKFPIVEPKTVKVPRTIPGKKVSDADKARLAELIGQL